MKSNKKIIAIRLTIILFYLLCALFAIYLYFANPIDNDIYGFLIHQKSVIHCPSCGLTRSIYSLMHFDFKGAFYYHAFFVCTLPILGYLILTLTVNLFANKKIIAYPKRYSLFLYCYLFALIAFTIFRNFTSVIY